MADFHFVNEVVELDISMPYRSSDAINHLPSYSITQAKQYKK